MKRVMERVAKRVSWWVVRMLCPKVVVLCIVAATAATAASAQSGKPKLDRKLKAALEELGQDWTQARPSTRFEEWDPPQRIQLIERARQLSVPVESYALAVQTLWTGLTKKLPRIEEAIETPYGTATWIQRGRAKRWDPLDPKSKSQKLVIALHGGGEDAGSASAALGNWRVDDALAMYPQAIELVHDAWNTVEGERFVLTLMDIAKLYYDVDPDQVYVMGFSMGGTGSWFFAGRHPDLLAGAIPAHGVIMAAPQAQLQTKEEVQSMQHGLLPNVRNLPVIFSTGGVDRNCRPGTFLYAWDRLQELRERDPEGYGLVKFVFRPELDHSFAKGEPELSYDYVFAHLRQKYPEKIVWEYAADPFPMARESSPSSRLQKQRFYSLYCQRPQEQMWIELEHRGNRFDLKLRGVNRDAIALELNSEMIDPEQPVEVWIGDQQVYLGRPEADFGVVVDTLDARLDRRMWFDRRIQL